MEKKEKITLTVVYMLIFFIAVYADIKSGNLEQENFIYREAVDGESVEVDLLLNIEDIFEDYELHLEVTPQKITKEEAEKYFSKVLIQIDKDFKEIKKELPMKASYESEMVDAKWSFSPAGIIGVDGEIQWENIPEEGAIINAYVTLTCGAYEKIYSFPFRLEKPELTIQEEVENALFTWLEEQEKQEGTNIFQLPDELSGLSLQWSEKRENLSFKILFLEGLSVLLLFLGKKKEKENQERKRRQQRDALYPEVVNQLLILLEAGMTSRQAWHRLAHQYTEKKKRGLVEEEEVYSAIVQLDRRLSEGEKEKTAYEGFAKQLDSMCYRRLVRLLINNLEKGNKDICQQLCLEAKQAYEQRILSAKKLGEEASTKMLVPMMFMMLLVMVIVMAPAIMGFSI